jgi:N-acetylneuraminic acid mutarotase
MNQARHSLGVAVVDGKIYAIGGMVPTVGAIGTNEMYDPKTGRWTAETSMPTPRYSFAIAAYGGKIYCMGGVLAEHTEGNDTVCEVYDPQTHSWKTGTPLPVGISLASANVIGDEIYVVLGYPNRTLTQVYNPATDTWTTRSPMPVFQNGACTVCGDKLYAFGGYYNTSFEGASYHMVTQIYDPTSDSWSLGVAPPKEFYVCSTAATSGFMAPKSLYVFTGGNQSNLIYNPDADTWGYGAVIPTARVNCGVAVVDDQIYVIGGWEVSINPDVNVWEITPNNPSTKTAYYYVNEMYTPLGYGTKPPEVSIILPSNSNQASSDVTVNFTVNRPVEWVQYSLDGAENKTASGNIVLSGLNTGAHNVTVYAKDLFGNIGASETVNFTVTTNLLFIPIGVGVCAAAIITASALLYHRKHTRSTKSA